MLLTCAAHTLALATSLSAALWQGKLPLPADCQQTSHFLGFSANERAYAQRIDALCRPDGQHQDRFSLVVLVDAEQAVAVGVFRLGSLHRERGVHKPIAYSNKVKSRYPLWSRALPQASWNKTARLGQFAFVRHDFADDVVRVRPVDAAALEVKKNGNGVVVAAKNSNSLAFAIMVRAMDGTQHEVAQLQLAGSRQSSLHLLYSKHGHRVAIGYAHNAQTLWIVPSTQLTSPISSIHLGAPNTMAWEEGNVQELYESLHPRGMTRWDDYVGNIL